MSSIIDYVKNLLPVYERRDLLSTLTGLQNEHNDTLMPIVNDIREVFKGHTYKSKLYLGFEQRLRRHVNFNQPAMDLLMQSIERIQANIPFLEREIRANFSVSVATDGLTYDSVNVLRYLEAVGFYVRYARKFLLKVLADEATLLGGTPPNWVKGELEYLDNNLDNFVGLFTSINMPESELKQTFRKVTTAVVDAETNDLAVRSLGNSKVDPMRLAHFSPQRNWILSIGKTLVEWQVNRYRAAKEDLVALQMRLQEMRELQASGKASPKIQGMIVQLERRVSKLDAKIAEIEEDARERLEV